MAYEAKYANELLQQHSKKVENEILEQLTDLTSRGLLVIEAGPVKMFMPQKDVDGKRMLTMGQTIKLVLKDKEYIEFLEKENKSLKELVSKLREAQ